MRTKISAAILMLVIFTKEDVNCEIESGVANGISLQNSTPITFVPDVVSYPAGSQGLGDEVCDAGNWSAAKGDNGNSNNTITQAGFHGEDRYFSGIPVAQDAHTNTFTEVESSGSVLFDLRLNECNNNFGHLQVKGREGTILFSFSATNNTQDDRAVIVCDVELIVPPATVACIQVIEADVSCLRCEIQLRDEEDGVMFEGCPRDLPKTFVTYTNFLKLRVKLISLQFSFFLRLNFTSLPESSRPQWQTNFTSPTTGYLETSQGSQPISRLPFINTWIRLVPPDDYGVVINLHLLSGKSECLLKEMGDRDHVIFYTRNISKVYHFCKHIGNFADPFVNLGEVHVQYVSYSGFLQAPFRIWFSFHRLSALPVQLSDDRWNCSAVYWPDMQQHFPCNFVSECVGGEDEAGCWRTNSMCGHGQLQADGRCFSVLSVDEEKASWKEANQWCQGRGGRLASLSTRKRWDTIAELFTRLQKGSVVYIGARSPPPAAHLMYRNSWMWSDGTIAHFIDLTPIFSLKSNMEACATIPLDWIYKISRQFFLDSVQCDSESFFSYRLCEMPAAAERKLEVPEIFSARVTSRFVESAYIQCPSHHFTHVFLACDDASSCWFNPEESSSFCSAPLTSLPPPFTCASGLQSIPYTVVCDHSADCKDGSDEDFCHFPPCEVISSFRCGDGRCVHTWQRCNRRVDCADGTDEQQCPELFSVAHKTIALVLPIKIDLNSAEDFTYTELKHNASVPFSCSDTHFMCASLHQVCLPVYLRCNGMYDCPEHEDEAECDSYTCQGFYRCRGSQVCVHVSHVCDGLYQCPQRDDEILCNETCPENCMCHGWSFICSDIFCAASYFNLRYLDARDTSMTLADLENNTFLVHLSLIRCNLSELQEVTLHNLRSLDVSNNQLTHIGSGHFAGLRNLEILKISNNPLKVLSFQELRQACGLKVLDMSSVRVSTIDLSIFTFFSKLVMLNLSGAHLYHVTGSGFLGMTYLRVLDLRVCPVTVFPPGIFQGLHNLDTIYADNYKLCCPATLPRGFNVQNCHAPSDEVSSCDDLLRSNLYRVGLAIFASLGLLGNLGSLVYRLIFRKTTGKVGYDVFVTNLSMADFLMGVYLLVIGVADHKYKGVYLWEDVGWRSSSICKVAGVVCLLSSEVSVFIIFFITVDRFLVVRFPLSQLHFSKCSAQLACTGSWLVGICLAAIPLLPMTSQWDFYGQTSICIPLPTSKADFPGRMYSFGVIIILNFVFFLLILIGQILIYWSVQSNSISAESSSKLSKDLIIARRLITVVMSDFLCWFPVGLTGLLASRNVPISSEINVVIAIFVLPFNSALNPFLYTINVYLERRRREREEQRRKCIVAQLKSLKTHTGGENHKSVETYNYNVQLTPSQVPVTLLSPETTRNVLQGKR